MSQKRWRKPRSKRMPSKLSSNHSKSRDTDCSCGKCQRSRTYDLYPPNKKLTGEQIGAGTFGRIYRHATDPTLAVKYILLDACRETPLIECALMSSLQHPGLVRAEEIIVENGNRVYIMMPLAEYDLKQYSRQHQISKSAAMKWLQQILAALEFLHQLDMIHADIKMNNILLYPNPDASPPYQDFDYDAKLVDFGKTRYQHSRFETKAVPQIVSPPEYLADNVQWSFSEHAKTLDIWALGATWVEVHCGHRLYPEQPIERMETVKASIAKIESETPLGQLIHKMLIIQPVKRLSARKLLDDPLFNETKIDTISGKILNTSEAALTAEERELISLVPSYQSFDILPYQWISLVAAKIKWAQQKLDLNLEWKQVMRLAIMLVLEMQYDVAQIEDNFRKLSKAERESLFTILRTLQFRILKG